MPDIEVKVLAASKASNETYKTSIVTFELLYPRYIHAELMTHRVFSRNAASSRAIPTYKLIELVETDPVVPLFIGKNQPGMQAEEELDEEAKREFIKEWVNTGKMVAEKARELLQLNVHKQTINRMLEPWLPIRVVLTATDFKNFFELRDSPYAQPEIQVLARKMKKAIEETEFKELSKNEWHLPYITDEDKEFVEENYKNSGYMRLNLSNDIIYYKDAILAILSAARCARVSHALGGLSKKTIEEEIKKGMELYKNKHMSPFEHQAKPWFVDEMYHDIFEWDFVEYFNTPDSMASSWFDVRNLRGWRSLRSFIEQGEVKYD